MSVCARRSGAVMLEWTAPLPLVAEWSQDHRRSQRWRRVMQIAVIGLDLAKNVFQVHGIDDSGKAVLKRKLRRSEVPPFFAGLAPALVGIEACHTAHYWGREIAALGHDVRLMPPQFVKPYVKSQKNDAADAEAASTIRNSADAVAFGAP